MTLPVVTRFVKVEAPDGATDPADAFAVTTYETLHDSARAHIGNPTARNSGDRWQETDRILYVDDTVSVPITARITDLSTGDVYAVLWTENVVGFGLDHRKVGMRKSVGAAP